MSATAFSVDENEVTAEELAKTTNMVNSSIQQLLNSVAVLNPGIRQCESAGKVVHRAINELDASLLTLASCGKLPLTPIPAKTLVEAQRETARIAKNLVDNIMTLVDQVTIRNVDGIVSCALKN